MNTFAEDALEMAIDRIGSPNSPREAAGVFMCAEAIMFDFVVPAEQAFAWLDSLEYIRKSRALAEAQASRFMVTDCKQTYGLSGKSFEDAFADAEKRSTGEDPKP